MLQADLFLIADELPFSRSGWVHRNRVLGPNGAAWLRLPVVGRSGQRIDEMRLDSRAPWRRTHLRTLAQFYARSPHAAEELELLEPLLDQSAALAVDVTVPLIEHLSRRLEIATPVVRSSDLGLEARYHERFPDRPGPSHQILSYLIDLGATELLEGASGQDFLDVALLDQHGIAVWFHDYEHPTYLQRRAGFTSHLSVVDLLLTAGAGDAASVVRAARGHARRG